MRRRKQLGTGTTEPSGAVARHRNRGFSLVEMIAAMAILSVMVLLINRLFVDAQQSMQIGTRSAEVNANARAVLEFMARDVQTAMFDTAETKDVPPYLLLTVRETRNVESTWPSDDTYLGLSPSGGRELGFVAPINTPQSARRRETKIVVYRMRRQRVSDGPYLDHRYELMRGEFYDDNMGRYTDPEWDRPYTGAYEPAWLNNAQVMIQNVRSVRFNYGTDIAAAVDPFVEPEARTDDEATPLAFLDIHLELLSPHDARQAADLFSGWNAMGAPARQNAVAFVERAVRRYHQRVFFFNAQGYYREHR